MKAQRKRDASRRPHKAAARHSTPAWKAFRWPMNKFIPRLIDERREVEFWPVVRPRG